MGNQTDRIRAMLDERGIHWWAGESEDQTRWKGSGLTWEFEEGVGRAFLGVCEQDVTPEQAIAATLCEYTYEQWRAINEIVGNAMEYAHDIAIMHPDKADPCWDLSNYVDQILEVAFDKHEHDLTPEQAIAATVGDKHKDNPRNYKPNGKPKIPSMSVGADPDWVDWVASLEHKKPSGLTEAVQQLMFEVICFGGEMGPNDCGGENCPDEGMVYTEEFIRGWVKRISAMIGRSCAACPEMDNPDSYIFHLMRALEHERGCCRDCKHSHMTSDGKHCKWCSVLATHKIDGEGCCDPSNGYDPEPYFDAGFHCGFFERRVSE